MTQGMMQPLPFREVYLVNVRPKELKDAEPQHRSLGVQTFVIRSVCRFKKISRGASNTMYRNCQCAAFTLTEVMLALGLLALIAGLAAANWGSLLTGLEDKPLPELFKHAIREARLRAAHKKEPVFLAFDEESSSLKIYSSNNFELDTIATGYPPEDPNLRIEFYKILPGKGAKFVRTPLSETVRVKRLAFNPDRSSTPFEVVLGDAIEVAIFRFDIFSDTVIETESY